MFYGYNKIFVINNKCRYEGEFLDGWFHGYGVFWRCDGMRYEGEFRGGKIWGLGMSAIIIDTSSPY